MKIETCLEIQASVDGELDASRQAAVEHLCAGDPAARRLSNELGALRDAVRSNEPEFSVPETREFYWSQIHRRMNAADTEAGRKSAPGSVGLRWLRWLIPVAGAAAVVSLLTLPEREKPATATLASRSPARAALASATQIVYRSDSDGVTVHWID